jgi:tetratricopeptide (TPR) repeat protein
MVENSSTVVVDSAPPASDEAWPDAIAPLVETARRAAADGRADDAVEPLADAFAHAEFDRPLLERLAGIVRELGLAAQLLQRLGARADEAQQAERWLVFARAQRHLASAPLAVGSYRRAMQLQATALGWFELAEAAEAAADVATAAQAYREAERLCEDAPDRVVVLAELVLLHTRNGDFDAALAAHDELETARRALGADRRSPTDQRTDATLELVVSLLETERVGDLQRLLRSPVIDGAPDAMARAFALARARLALASGDIGAAIEAFELGRPPASQRAAGWRFWYALALERSGRLQEAEVLLREAEQAMAAGEAAASMIPQTRARVLSELGRPDEARALLATIDVDALEGLPRSQTLLLRGTDALNRGDPAAALELVTAAQEGAPPTLLPELALWRAAALNALGRPGEALAMLQSTAASLSGAEVLGTRWAQETALALHATGDTAGAVETITRAFDATGDPAAKVWLALLRARLQSTGASAAAARDAYAVATEAAAPVATDPGRPVAARLYVEAAVAALAAADLESAARWAAEAVRRTRPEDGDLSVGARVLSARVALARGAHADALGLLRELRARDEAARQNVDVLALTWQALYGAEGVDAARRWLDDAAAELGPARAPAVELLRGETELRAGDFRAAQRHYARGAQLPEEASNDIAVAFASLMCAVSAADPTRVLELVDQVAKGRPLRGELARLQVFRAIALASLGRLDEAKRIFAQGVARDDPLVPLADLTYAQTLNATGDFTEALAVLDGLRDRLRAPAIDPALPMQAQIQRGFALLGLDRAPEALGAAETALGFGERGAAAGLLVPMARVQKALALHRSGKSDQALAVFQSLDDAPPPAEGMLAPMAEFVLLGHARVLYDLDREEECVALCQRAIALELPGPTAHELKGDALLVLQDYAGALAGYEEAFARARSDAERFDPLSGQGRAWHRQAEFEKAVECYRSALALRCQAAQRDWIVMFRLAETYEALGRERSALGAYRQAWTRYRGKRRPASIALGISACLLRQKQPVEALRFLEKEAPAAEPDPRLDHNRALALVQTGDLARALATARNAVARGVAEAKGLVESLAPRPASRSAWLDYWFDAQAQVGRRALAVLLLATAGTALVAPFLAALRAGTLDWKAALPLAVLALVLLLMPVMKQLSVGIGDVKLQLEPASASGSDRVDAPIRLPAPIGMAAFSAVPGGLGARESIVAGQPPAT